MSENKTPVSRRSFLKAGTLAAGSAAGALAAPAIVSAQGTQTLKMQSSWPASDVFQDMAKQYADRVEAMSGGRLKIDLLPAGAVVQAFQVQDAVADGVIDATHTVTAYWYGKNKAASLFGTGPVFGADASQILAWIHFGGGKDLYRELVQDVLGLNIVGFFALPMPTQPLGWFNQQITSVDQMKGLKYRTVGLATDIMQGMGLSVTQLPGGEIVPALERGVIEAFEFNNPTSDRRFGAQDVSKNYMLGSYHQAAEFFEIAFNKDLFDSLDPDLQAILEYGAEAANTANYGLAMDQYSKDLQGLINEDGVTVSRTPDAIMAAQLESWDTVLEGLMQDEFFAKVVDSQKAWSERVAFYSLMNQANYKLAYEHYFPGKLGF
ncbi:TRAP transporter substrate-binding protein [Afifella marina]|uniref:TRAP-type mannitol/chloroaromatic compound transport system, substrate-binding protein n=1 Tax=Afifella marina DSM 2698 TaxID=1120955 RepID=A0A1G5MYQ0_AFIMA|nr:TRAP transporter substrate-binding protein [Afifella marina]MBK1622197.1 C4-dicarboxylate ABC transporter [Afifella marina DSM 2698]MBK1628322.1 C4-dicarboxylate ABC transporter [Afifella marina]MBK5918981.1 C4-dicarboxylate ABC transporter [Afifella marina]RAI20277.1 C4-dicarboxylate ABC transporter [Afifella marina DSM 2698]SCZ30233.1 TRAP-type mannitol/chloroaromatic compound transport system, substrate-binding protein [Afifella marina DSM 2698]